ncbi:MAG: alpha/beta hydrolase [Bacteroidota bacterium]
MKTGIWLAFFMLGVLIKSYAQDSVSITLSNIKYPHPVKYLPVKTEGQTLNMAYMDVQPAKSNGKTIMLFHGKNFAGYYWTNVINTLTAKGYRVIVPDQVGFGKSDKALIHYSFHLLARFNVELLDALKIPKITLMGHSMGGMLATRFALMYPGRVNKLLLEDPIGLEDYRTFVPYVSIDQQYKTELKTTYQSVKKYYTESYFVKWKSEFDYLVRIGAGPSKSVNFARYAKVSALTFTMIYEQPVYYEFGLLKVPTVLFVGNQDKTIIGKALLSPQAKATHGQYQLLGPATAKRIPNCKLIAFDNCGHIPHVEIADRFLGELVKNL